MAILGLDTSCYRTSVALVEGGRVLSDRRRLLSVEAGGRGLRQSEAVFCHVQNIGPLMEALRGDAPNAVITGVCASARPRDVEGSYMPVFTVGENVARSLAASLNVPLRLTSHQQGHIRAVIPDTGMEAGAFLALHLSGGTTELLRVDERLRVSLLGGTSDLHAGQLVDRVGVKMGLPFPAGPALEALAEGCEAASRMPTSVSGMKVSLSGAEAQAFRMLEAGEKPGVVAAEIYSFRARTSAKLIASGVRETGIRRILVAGGVAASARFRTELPQRLNRLGENATLIWGAPERSGDNAIGVALIGEDTQGRHEQ